MHGRLACGRPLVVRLAGEKHADESGENASKGAGEASKTSGTSTPMSRSAKIAAIKNKLKTLEEEGSNTKKQKLEDDSCSDGPDRPIFKDRSKLAH